MARHYTNLQIPVSEGTQLEGPIYANISEGADAAGGISTSYSIQVGDTFTGALDFAGDDDWVAINLTAGTTYRITLSGDNGGGGTLADPYLRLYDAGGNQVALNDDGGTGRDSALTYLAASGGTYYVSARDYGDNDTGTYTIAVEEATPAPVGTLDELADYLTDGYWEDSGGSRHYFNTSSDNVISVNITALTADGQQLARWAFEAWEMVADIEFQEVSGSADITFDDNQAGAYASSNYSGSFITSSFVNISAGWLDSYGTTIDSYSFSTYIHEIGHALGLGHQGDYNGNATYGVDETFANDSWQISIMSYFNQTENTTTNASYAELISAMMSDIVAIQNLYGAAGNGSATAGNTIWGANSNLGGYLGAYFSTLTGASGAGVYNGGPVAFTVYDQGGTDTVDLSFSTTNDRIDMRSEQFSDVGGLIGNVGIARGTILENAITGSGDDTVIGNIMGNMIITNDGNDIVMAEGGWDRVWTGNGDDIVFGGAGNDLIGGLNGRDQLWGQDGDDTIYGGNYGDTIGGGAGNDYIRGDSGNDILWGGDGDDTILGGDQADAIGGGAGNDTIRGGNGYDALRGSSGDDTIYGDAQDDFIDGGTGNDQLYGGADNDTILGGFGLDTIDGGAGNDRIWGGWGDDMITGGADADTFVFSNSFGSDTITDFNISEGDILRLNDILWTAGHGALTATQVISTFGTVTDGNVVLTFDNGEVITLSGLTTTSGLDGALEIF